MGALAFHNRSSFESFDLEIPSEMRFLCSQEVIRFLSFQKSELFVYQLVSSVDFLAGICLNDPRSKRFPTTLLNPVVFLAGFGELFNIYDD